MVAGLSGGKDSTFVLHQLVRTYGLRVKVVTVANGDRAAAERRATTATPPGPSNPRAGLDPLAGHPLRRTASAQ